MQMSEVVSPSSPQSSYTERRIPYESAAGEFELAKEAGYIAIDSQRKRLEHDLIAISVDKQDVKMWARGLMNVDLSDPEAGAGFEIATLYAEGLIYEGAFRRLGRFRRYKHIEVPPTELLFNDRLALRVPTNNHVIKSMPVDTIELP